MVDAANDNIQNKVQLYQRLCDSLQQYAPHSKLQVPLKEHISTLTILQHSELFVAYPIAYRLMKPNQCHDNVLDLFHNKQVEHMCVGYALAPDRSWRYHSWGLTWGSEASRAALPTIVETTAQFLLYYGCVLVPTTK